MTARRLAGLWGGCCHTMGQPGPAYCPIQNAAVREGPTDHLITCLICGFFDLANPKGARLQFLPPPTLLRPLRIHPALQAVPTPHSTRGSAPRAVGCAFPRAHWWPSARFAFLSMDPAIQTVPFNVTYRTACA